MRYIKGIAVDSVVQVKISSRYNNCIGTVSYIDTANYYPIYVVKITDKEGEVRSLRLERSEFVKCKKEDYPELFI